MAVLLLRLSKGCARAGAGVRRQQADPAPRCDRLIQPLVAFPAHWSPMSILFYTGTMFPVAYRTGAFIAFHGSAYRAPLPQEGYHIVFLQFNDGMAGDYQILRDRVRRRHDEPRRAPRTARWVSRKGPTARCT